MLIKVDVSKCCTVINFVLCTSQKNARIGVLKYSIVL